MTVYGNNVFATPTTYDATWMGMEGVTYLTYG